MGSPALKKYKKILVRSVNWLGDAVMTTPFFSALKRALPDADIEVMALPYIAPVFENNPNISAIRILERKRGFAGLLDAALGLVRRPASGYDLGISLPNSIGAALDLRGAGCREVLGYNRDMRGLLLDHKVVFKKELYDFHEIFYYLNILKTFFNGSSNASVMNGYFKDTSKGREPAYELYLRESERIAARELLSGRGVDSKQDIVIGVNPGAFFGSAKRWPTQRYAQLVKAAVADEPSCRFLIFGSAKEDAIGAEICEGSEGRAINLCGMTSIRELIASIALCDLFVTNDSGAMHIAAAHGVPIVAIFGPTDFKSTYPVCKSAEIIRRETPCAPCKKRECPLGHHDCMQNITVDDVYSVIKKQIERMKVKLCQK